MLNDVCGEQEYVPSAWETEWQEHVAEYEENVCKWMLKDTPNVEHWMKMPDSYHATGPSTSLLAKFKQSTFSRFIYRCGNGMIKVPLNATCKPYCALLSPLEIII